MSEYSGWPVGKDQVYRIPPSTFAFKEKYYKCLSTKASEIHYEKSCKWSYRERVGHTEKCRQNSSWSAGKKKYRATKEGSDFG